jgi:hypothetical protein
MSLMKTLTVLLPEPVEKLVGYEAAAKGVDPAALCASILAEHFLSASIQTRESAVPPEEKGEEQMTFSVRDHFPGLPQYSVDFAQAIVNEALKVSGARAFKSNRGVGIEPNFVFIEYLRERAPGGIGLSFYGGPERHQNKLIRDGRTPSYSRALIGTPTELQSVLPHVRKAYAFKFGK